MTTYAIPQAVPDDCDYLTAGKRYQVEDGYAAGFFHILDDTGEYIVCEWMNCSHLNGGNWTRVETADFMAGLEAENERLRAVYLAAIALRNDMVMRAELNRHLNGGDTVVEAGAGVWSRFCQALGDEE